MNIPDEIQNAHIMGGHPEIQQVNLGLIWEKGDRVDELPYGIPALAISSGNKTLGQKDWIWNLCACLKLFSKGTSQSAFPKCQ